MVTAKGVTRGGRGDKLLAEPVPGKTKGLAASSLAPSCVSAHKSEKPRGTVGGKSRVEHAVQDFRGGYAPPERTEGHSAVRRDDEEAVEAGNAADHRPLVSRHGSHAEAYSLDTGAGERGEMRGHGRERLLGGPGLF